MSKVNKEIVFDPSFEYPIKYKNKIYVSIDAYFNNFKCSDLSMDEFLTSMIELLLIRVYSNKYILAILLDMPNNIIVSSIYKPKNIMGRILECIKKQHKTKYGSVPIISGVSKAQKYYIPPDISRKIQEYATPDCKDVTDNGKLCTRSQVFTHKDKTLDCTEYCKDNRAWADELNKIKTVTLKVTHKKEGVQYIKCKVTKINSDASFSNAISAFKFFDGVYVYLELEKQINTRKRYEYSIYSVDGDVNKRIYGPNNKRWRMQGFSKQHKIIMTIVKYFDAENHQERYKYLK